MNPQQAQEGVEELARKQPLESLPESERNCVERIASALGESTRRALEQIGFAVRDLGEDRVDELLHQAMESDANGDRKCRDGSTRKLGGIFFFLAKEERKRSGGGRRVNSNVQKAIEVFGRVVERAAKTSELLSNTPETDRSKLAQVGTEAIHTIQQLLAAAGKALGLKGKNPPSKSRTGKKAGGGRQGRKKKFAQGAGNGEGEGSRSGHPPQGKGTRSVQHRARKVKSKSCMAHCSFCGLKQKSPRKRLECIGCGRTDINPVIVQDTKQQREANRKPVPTPPQPAASRTSQSVVPPAVKSVPIRGTQGKPRKGESATSYGYGSIAAAEPWVDNVGPDGWRLHGG